MMSKTFRTFFPNRATVTIEITDENDNAPIWLYPRAPDDSRIQIGVEFPTTRIITRVRAVDADSGKNARIIYSLEDASFVHFSHDRTCDLFALFSLESTTGHLRMREGISPCIKPGDSVRLLLRATDGGTPPLSKDAEFFLEFKAGSEVLNIPPESTFLTQADEAFGNKPLSSESQIRESLVQTDSAGSLTTEEDTELAGTKRMYVFVLMIVVPVAAILLCCCLVTTLLFVIRSRRRRRPRRSGFKESCVLNELDVLQAEIGTNRFSSLDTCSGRNKSPTPSTSQMVYSTDARTLSSQQRLRPGGGNDFVHTITGIHLDDATSVHSGDVPPEGKVVYPIYLKPLVGEPTTSAPAGDAVIRLTSIPELEGTILVPLPRHNLTTPTVNYHQPVSEAVSVDNFYLSKTAHPIHLCIAKALLMGNFIYTNGSFCCTNCPFDIYVANRLKMLPPLWYGTDTAMEETSTACILFLSAWQIFIPLWEFQPQPSKDIADGVLFLDCTNLRVSEVRFQLCSAFSFISSQIPTSNSFLSVRNHTELPVSSHCF